MQVARNGIQCGGYQTIWEGQLCMLVPNFHFNVQSFQESCQCYVHLVVEHLVV
jgi:hypothetical protein